METNAQNDAIMDAFLEGYSAGFYEPNNPGDGMAAWHESEARAKIETLEAQNAKLIAAVQGLLENYWQGRDQKWNGLKPTVQRQFHALVAENEARKLLDSLTD